MWSATESTTSEKLKSGFATNTTTLMRPGILWMSCWTGLKNWILNFSTARRPSWERQAGNLFRKTDPGSAYQRLVTQFSWLGSIAREGALFDMIGRRRT